MFLENIHLRTEATKSCCGKSPQHVKRHLAATHCLMLLYAATIIFETLQNRDNLATRTLPWNAEPHTTQMLFLYTTIHHISCVDY